jgi:hypothetical protein
MHTMKKIWVLATASILLSICSDTQAQLTSSSQILAIDPPDEVEVGDFMDLSVNSSGQTCAGYNLRLTLGIDHNFETYIGNAFDVSVGIEYSLNGGTPQTAGPLFVHYDPTAATQMIDLHTVDISASDNVIVTITSITSTQNSPNLPENVYLNAELTGDCFTEFDYSNDINIEQVSFLNPDCSEGLETTADEIRIAWEAIAGATDYHLEWTFVNNYSATTNQYLSMSDLEYNFRMNSTRVVTKDNFYVIPNLFDRGFLCVRVRGLGQTTQSGGYIFPGNWSIGSDIGLVSALDTDDPDAVTDVLFNHEPDLNWQVTTTFAEEGKKKEVISYFDGSQRNRQTLTRINSNNKIVVGETIYDYQGRPAINVLPVPINDPTCVNNGDGTSSLHYYPLFNTDNQGGEYTAEDFDKDAVENSECQSMAASDMSDSSGASKYYSTNNDEMNMHQAYVPDAGGYPYTQVEYTPDNTGRVRRQSGVGPEFQLENGNVDHETNYYYGTPHQEQLDRLFGNEVGNASHYQKNMVVDPNGQTSVSYLDMEGRTIATALAGDAPENLRELNNHVEAQALTADLFNKDANGVSSTNIVVESDASIVFGGHTITVPVNGTHVFRYNLNVDTLELECMTEDVCISCAYNLSIHIEDECGQELNPGPFNEVVGHFSEQNGQIIFSADCPETTTLEYSAWSGNQPAEFEIPLTQGTYTIYKTLEVNPEARDFYFAKYVESADTVECLMTFYDFYEEQLALIDTMDCYIDCESCIEDLGSRDDYIASGLGSGEDWDAAIEECNENCNLYVDPCEQALEMMLADMSPYGQYATFNDVDGEINTLGPNHGLSVFRVPNHLPNPDTHWRSPYNPLAQAPLVHAYANEFGERTKVWLFNEDDGLGNDIWNYNLVDGAPVYETEEGASYTYPEYLENLTDFIHLWEEGWEYSLITYHPEWCYYEECVALGPADGEANSTPLAFDRILSNTTTFQAAINADLISPSFQITNWLDIDVFLEESSPYSDYFLEQWNDYVFGLSLVEFATLMHNQPGVITNINNVPSSMYNFQTTAQGYANDADRDALWQTLKTLYLSAKRNAMIEFLHIQVLESGCYGWNECFGEENWNPWWHPEFSQNTESLSDSYFSDIDQPCGLTMWFRYKYKTPRFVGIEDFTGMDQAANPEYIEYQLFMQTGQCPVDLSLQYLLNDLAAEGDLLAPLNLLGRQEMTALALEIADEITEQTVANGNWTWTPNELTNGNLEVLISDPSPSLAFTTCTLTFNPPTDENFSTNFNWNTVIGFQGLDYVSASTYDFNVQILANNDMGQPEWISIFVDNPCIPIGQCNFGPFQTPNDLATQLQYMMNYSLQSGNLWSTNGAQFMYDNPLNYPLVDEIVLNQISANYTDVIEISFQSTNQIKVGKLSGSGDFILLNILSTNPLNYAFSSIPSTYHFENLNTECENLWSVDVMDANGSLVVTLHGEAWIDPSTGATYPLSLGSCGYPNSLTCVGPEYDNWNDLQVLLSHELPDYAGNSTNITLSEWFTDNLMSYANSPIDIPLNSPQSFDTETGKKLEYQIRTASSSSDECSIDLYYNGPFASSFDFNYITHVLSFELFGEPDDFGYYYEFKMAVEYAVNSNLPSNRTLHGYTCFPILLCANCEETVELAGPKKIADNSVEAYGSYLDAIDSFNSRFGLLPTDSTFITPRNYEWYFFSASEQTTEQYNRYLLTFDSLVDDMSWASDIEIFAVEYGNYINSPEEYGRYSRAVNLYNQSVAPANQVQIASYILFTDERLAYITWDYVAYILGYSNPGNTPMNIVAYRDLYYGIPTTDECRLKYQQYLNAHRYFVYSQTIEETCINFQSLHPLYSYEDFVDEDLCCSEQTLQEFEDYIGTFFNTNSCPPGMPFVEECAPSELKTSTPKDCQSMYSQWRSSVTQYNHSAYAAAHQHSLFWQINYQSFVSSGYCDCVRDYLQYLAPYTTASANSSLPIPVTIDEFCDHVEKSGPCDYQEYLIWVSLYNSFVQSNPNEGYEAITSIVTQSNFELQELCDCMLAWTAWLTGVMNGSIEPPSTVDEIKMYLDLSAFCEQPCAPEPLATGPLPTAPYVNPCVQQLLNTAYNNAQTLYDQYMDELATQFAQKYNEHCLAVVENFEMDYVDQEYHFTLYYYDQAGNLVKTVPPCRHRNTWR